MRVDELRPQAQLPQRYQVLVEQVVDQTRLETDIPLHDLEGGSQSRGDRALIEGRRDDREHGRERGPQLVAQLGQECVLGLIGLLGRDPGRASASARDWAEMSRIMTSHPGSWPCGKRETRIS